MEIREFLSEVAHLRVNNASGDEVMVYCPWHDDQNASLAINYKKGAYHCFSGCVKGSGGLRPLFKELDPSGHIEERFMSLFVGHTVSMFAKIEKLSDTQTSTADGYDVNELPLAIDNDYLIGRGVTNETVQHFNLKYHAQDDCIVIPIGIKGESFGYIRRNISSNPKYLNSKDMKRDVIVYPFDQFEAKDNTVFVCEGPFDAIKAHQLGLKNTVCTLGGTISDNQARLIGELGSRVILCVDKDDSGIRITESNAKKLTTKFGFWVEYTCAPGIAKDFGDLDDLNGLEIMSPYKLKAINRDLSYLIQN